MWRCSAEEELKLKRKNTQNIPCNQDFFTKVPPKTKRSKQFQNIEICMYPICLFAFAMSRLVPSIVCLCKVGFVREKWRQWNVNIVPGPNWWSWQWPPFKKLDSQNSPKLSKVDVANGPVTWFDVFFFPRTFLLQELGLGLLYWAVSRQRQRKDCFTGQSPRQRNDCFTGQSPGKGNGGGQIQAMFFKRDLPQGRWR